MKNKKVVIGITSIVAVLLVIIGVTYAYWLVTKSQTNQNIISSGCLDISLTGEKNDITLTDQFPLSDEDGMKLVPYEFTVTNNCNTSVDYQVNLESIGDSANAIKANAIKVALNDEIKLLTAGGNTEPTLSGAYESNRILFGTLASKGEADATKTYKLRLWIDEDAPISEQNKTFQSKISITIGQGVTNPYKEGTLAYDILEKNGGADVITSLSAEWQEGDVSAVTATSQYFGTSTIYSNYWYGTSYTFDKKTGYKLSGILTQATLTECRNGTKTCGKYTLQKTGKDDIYQTLYEVTAFGPSGDYVTAKTINATNNFSVGTTASDAGLYKTIDDLGDSYYFRGAPTNNYVKFGTYAKDTTFTVTDNGTYPTEEKTIEVKAGDPMYWRIVRINGDGTIRLVYDGTAAVANGVAHTATIGSTAYNFNSYDLKYVGYTYNDETKEVDSTIKGVVDKWYEDNLEATYGKYIADSIFCNDREETYYTYYDANYSQTTADKAVYTDIHYGPDSRLIQNKAPKLTCTRKVDRYTISDKTGNGILTKPVGLLTADEAFFAGGTTSSNNTYYLYSNEEFWTSAPSLFYGDVGYVEAWHVYEGGRVSSDYVGNVDPGARPVISLKADVKFTGNGRIDTNTPYEIVME